MREVRAMVVVCAGLLTSPVLALDLIGTYQLAHESDPVFLGAQAQYKADKHKRIQAAGYLLPRIDSSAGASQTETAGVTPAPYETRGYGLSITQPLFNPALGSALGRANAEVRQAEAEFANARQDLMLRTAERYLGVLGARDGVELAQAERAAIARQLEAARGRLEVGLGTITEVHDANARFQLAEAGLLEAQSTLVDRLDALRELTGELPDELQPLKAEIPAVRPDPQDEQQWLAKALKDNLGLKSRQAAVDAARKQVGLRRSGHWPTVDIVGSRRHTTTDQSGVTPDSTSTSVGLELKLPVFQGGIVTSQTAQAKHLLEAARQSLEGGRREVRRETRSAYNGVLTGLRRIDALKQAVVASQSALNAKTTGFEAGINTNLDVLDAQRDLFRTRRDYAQARYTYIIDLLSLKKAAGQLGEVDLKEINGWLQ